MQSTLIPFNEILEYISDDTGITNLSNYSDKIRRWFIRAEQRIGYSGVLVMKKITYTRDDVNWTGKFLHMPLDAHSYLEIYVDGVRINDVHIRSYGNRLQLDCTMDDKSTLELIYYGFMFDVEGNPMTPRTHADALTSYVTWKLFAAKAFLEPTRRSRGVSNDYRQEWYDERDAVQGEEAFFQNDEQYEVFSTIRNFSTKDAVIYYPAGNLECDAIIESKETCVLKPIELEINVYAFQYGNRVTDISSAGDIDQSWLDQFATPYPLQDIKEGVVVPYNQIGRIGFAIQGGSKERVYAIYDTFNSDITDIVFDHFYNPILDLDIYVSKTFYSHSNIFFKLKDV